MNQSTQRRLNFIFLISKFVIAANERGIKVMPTAFFRSAEEVHQLFLEGKSNADGRIRISKHQLWRAMDFVIIENGEPVWDHIPEYDILGEIWEELGGVWGSRWFKMGKTKFDDIFHFEI